MSATGSESMGRRRCGLGPQGPGFDDGTHQPPGSHDTASRERNGRPVRHAEAFYPGDITCEQDHVTAEQIHRVLARLGRGFYDGPDAQRVVAQKLLPDLGVPVPG